MPDARFEAILERKGSGTFVVVPVDVPAVFGKIRLLGPRAAPTYRPWAGATSVHATSSADDCTL